MEKVPHTQNDWQSSQRARALVAELMGVNDRYVGLAKRLKESSLELFGEVRSGQLTLSEALQKLDGPANDPQAARIKSVRSKLNTFLKKNPDLAPTVLDRIEALLAEFAG